jgi:CysZ protein
MMIQPLSGAGYFLRGLGLIGAPGVRRYVVLPLAINIVVFGVLIWAAVGQLEHLIDWITPGLPEWLAWLAWLLWIAFVFATAVVVFFTFSILANLIGAPFNGLLAEAVERHLTGEGPAQGGGLAAALKQAPVAIADELGKLLYAVKWAIPLLLLFVIPVLNLAAPLLWALFGAWMLAVEYADYPMSNDGLKGSKMRRRLAEKRVLSLGFGGAAMLATMIPVINFLVMPAAVAGATAMWVEQFRAREI